MTACTLCSLVMCSHACAIAQAWTDLANARYRLQWLVRWRRNTPGHPLGIAKAQMSGEIGKAKKAIAILRANGHKPKRAERNSALPGGLNK